MLLLSKQFRAKYNWIFLENYSKSYSFFNCKTTRKKSQKLEFSRRPEFCNSPSSKFEKFFQSMLIIRIEKLPPSWWLGLTTVLTRLQYESKTFQQSCPGFN